MSSRWADMSDLERVVVCNNLGALIDDRCEEICTVLRRDFKVNFRPVTAPKYPEDISSTRAHVEYLDRQLRHLQELEQCLRDERYYAEHGRDKEPPFDADEILARANRQLEVPSIAKE